MCCQRGTEGLPEPGLLSSQDGEDVGKVCFGKAELPSPACPFLTASALKITREEIAKHSGRDQMNLQRQLQAASWPQPYLKSLQKITLSLWPINNPLWLGWSIWLNFCCWGQQNVLSTRSRTNCVCSHALEHREKTLQNPPPRGMWVKSMLCKHFVKNEDTRQDGKKGLKECTQKAMQRLLNGQSSEH